MVVAFNLPKLQVGDAVALIAPASGQKADDKALVNTAITLLHDWGLHVVQTPTLQQTHYLAADDHTRASELRQALTTPDIKAIFVTRGGYGCARLLPLLGGISVPTPRYLVGFSDITTLHLYFAEQVNVYRMHGLNLATRQCLADTPAAEQNRQALHAALFAATLPPMHLTPLFAPVSSSAMAILQSAPLTGGCLSLLATSLGTAHEIQTAGKTVIIEDIGEAPYKIDRLLTHLKNAGKFDSAAGIILAELVGCDSANLAVQDVLRDVLADVPCPVLCCQGIGHGACNFPWVYGCSIRNLCTNACT